MHGISKLSVQGFRRLHNIHMEMRPLMVIIGANGAGKTSLLDAIALLAATADGQLNKTLGNMGGMADTCTRDRTKKIVFGASKKDSSHEPLDYQLDLEARGQAYAIVHESLTKRRSGFAQPFKHLEAISGDVCYYDMEERALRPTWDHSPKESSLSQVPKMFKKPEAFRKTLSAVTQYHTLDVGSRAPVKLPQHMKPADLPGANGEDLVSLLFTLRESDPDRYEIVHSALKTAFPGFESLSFPPAATGMLSLTWKEKSFRDPLYMHQLSEGTLRFLWLTALLQSPGLATLTMIDEPEVSLHPERLSLLADMMRETSMKTQMITATHSDRLVRFLEPKEVMVLDVGEEGHTTATWGDDLDLDAWLEEYTLDAMALR